MNEETIRFGRSSHLVGTLARPEPQAGLSGPRIAVLMTNAGVISRVGPRRINVRIAHRLAVLGVPSLRWDLSGLGDSGRSANPGARDEEFVSDTVDAMQVVSRTLGVDTFVMIGFCSGAQVAMATALRDDRLRGLVLFDDFKFPTYRSTVRWWLRKIRLLGPMGLVPALVRALADRLGPPKSGIEAEELALRNAEVAFPTRLEYAGRVQALVRRNIRLLFVYSGAFPRVFNYAGQFHDLFGKVATRPHAESMFMPGSDHLITPAAEQSRLIDRIVSWVIPISGGSAPKTVALSGTSPRPMAVADVIRQPGC